MQTEASNKNPLNITNVVLTIAVYGRLSLNQSWIQKVANARCSKRVSNNV